MGAKAVLTKMEQKITFIDMHEHILITMCVFDWMQVFAQVKVFEDKERRLEKLWTISCALGVSNRVLHVSGEANSSNSYVYTCYYIRPVFKKRRNTIRTSSNFIGFNYLSFAYLSKELYNKDGGKDVSRSRRFYFTRDALWRN